MEEKRSNRSKQLIRLKGSTKEMLNAQGHEKSEDGSTDIVTEWKSDFKEEAEKLKERRVDYEIFSTLENVKKDYSYLYLSNTSHLICNL